MGEAVGVSIAAFFVTIAAAFPAVVWVLKRYPLTLWRALLSTPHRRSRPARTGTDPYLRADHRLILPAGVMRRFAGGHRWIEPSRRSVLAEAPTWSMSVA